MPQPQSSTSRDAIRRTLARSDAHLLESRRELRARADELSRARDRVRSAKAARDRAYVRRRSAILRARAAGWRLREIGAVLHLHPAAVLNIAKGARR